MARTWTASQEDAITLRGRLLVVSAAAGSGKTSVLTERIIRMLTDPVHPAELSRLLIVTFTRAAASELKSRISEALGGALAADPGNTHLSRQILSLGSAHISTIDAFFGEEVRAGFAVLGLPPSFRVADEGELDGIALPLMEEALSELYEAFTTENSSDPADPFARLRNNRFAGMMDHLLKNRRGDALPAQLWHFFRRFSNYPEGIGLLAANAADLRTAAGTDFFSSLPGQTVCKSVRTLCADTLRGLDGVLRDLRQTELLPKYEGSVLFDSDFCRALLQACSGGSYDAARAALAGYTPGRLPAMRGEKPAVLERYKALRDGLKDAVKDLCGDLFRWSGEEIRHQLSLHADEFEMLHTLFSRFAEKLDAEKRLRGILSFDDMPALLRRLLEQPDGTPTLYAKSLSDRFDAVFIDEYQDVNPIQDRLFADIGGERRFMVGDIKQSIYGFRGGEPSIFADYRRAFPLLRSAEDSGQGGVCVFMSENFRCSQPVIDYANRICSFLFSACPESVGYRPQDDLVCGKQSPSDRLRPVQTLAFEPYTDEMKQTAADAGETLPNREALWCAAEIARLIREERLEDGSPIRPRDIAVLFRKSAPMQVWSDALAAWGIPVSAPAADDLLQSPLMTDTLNLLRAIDNPYRDLPLSEYLLTPAGGFSLEALGDIRAAEPDRRSLYDAMCAAGENPAHPCHAQCAAFVSWLERYRSLASVQPVDRFLRLLFLDPLLSPYAATPELRVLYEQARQEQALSWCGLYGFLCRFDRLCESGDGLPAGGFRKAQDAVTLMTVHKSKGLEFPVVILAGCGAPFSNKTFTEPLLFHRSVGCASALFDPESGETRPSVLLSAVTDAVRDEEREEEIRNLYVGLTRARERLYVTGTLRGKSDNALAKAALISYGSRTQILGASSRLLWILAALSHSSAGYPDTLRVIPPDTVIPVGNVTADTPAAAPEDTAARPEPTAAWDISSYPYLALRDVPTKAAASALSRDYLDRVALTDSTDDPAALAEAIGVLKTEASDFDALLSERKKTAPTEIGTAMHLFLEICDFHRLAVSGTDAEIARLQNAGILPDASARLLNRRQLELFRQSALMQDILSAREILREQKFGMNLPLSALTRHPERFASAAGETVFVQGSIDLLLIMPDGSVRLYDYKTDRLTDAERADRQALARDLSLRHGAQLACYAQAVRALFGAPPARTSIYSFPTADTVEVKVDSELFWGKTLGLCPKPRLNLS